MRRLVPVLVVMVVSSPLRGQESWTERVIDQDINVPIQVDSCLTSILEALNAVVRTYGTLFWSVNYCQPPARHEHALILLTTFDGSGLGSHSAVLTDANGKRFSPCQGKSFR